MRWGDEVKVLYVPREDWKDAWGPYPADQSSLVGKIITAMLTDPIEGLSSLYIRRPHGDMDVIWPTKYLVKQLSPRDKSLTN